MKTLLASLSVLLLAACGLVDEPELGDVVSGPFAVAGQPGTRNVYVLNSSFSGQYRNGSILRYELDAAGTGLTKGAATAVPRLGADLVASPDGKLLVGVFNAGVPRLKFFATSPEGDVSDLGFEYETTVGIAAQVQFFTPQQAKAGESYLTFVEDPGAIASRVVVMRLTSSGVERLFTLPDDLPAGLPEDYQFGYTAPAFVREQGLFVAFPQGATGVEPNLPDPIDYLKGDFSKVKKSDTDLRIVSMAVVDFDAVLANKGLGASTAFRPLIYDADVRAGNVKFPSDADENKDLRYRDRFTSAVGLDQTNCLEGGVPTDTARRADALFVADDSTQDVLVFEGFAKLKAALAALPAAAGSKHKDRLLAEGDVTYKPYSRKKNVLDIDTEEDMRISRMRIVKRGADCVPVWLRLERGRASQGSEVSRLQANHKRKAMNPLSYVIPTVGSASFGLLSVGTGAQARAFAFTTSYSLGDIHAFEYKASPQSASVDNFVQLQ